MMTGTKELFTELMDMAGVRVNGPKPWDIKVYDDRVYPRVIVGKNLGLGESYMERLWDCERVDEFIARLLRSGIPDKVRGGLRLLMGLVPALICNLQTRTRAQIVAKRHYDLGNELFGAILDPYRQYSCGYFKDTDDLAEAQLNKMRLICEKLNLRAGHKLLDIGCGWGGLARFAAENYGCEVVGVNISREQIAFARDFCKGLPVEIRNCDYRLINEPFDRIVSVGMFEHVGAKNYRAFMRVARRCMKDDGVFLLHTIGSNVSDPWCDPWITRYIFPNGCLPGPAQITEAAEGLFMLEDWHNLGPHYDQTLMRWLENFRQAWPSLQNNYDETFRRMWEYYLQSCAGAFRARDIQLWQIVFTPMGAEQPCCRLA